MNDGGFDRLLAQVRDHLNGLSGPQLAALRAVLEPPSMLAACLALIERFGYPCRCCPHCGASRIHRHGMSSGLQRYRCQDCTRTFNALTNTPLAYLRLRDKWLPYLQCVLDSLPVRGAAGKTGIHRNTSFRWRHRFLMQARHDRPPLLRGIVEADETYLG